MMGRPIKNDGGQHLKPRSFVYPAAQVSSSALVRCVSSMSAQPADLAGVVNQWQPTTQDKKRGISFLDHQSGSPCKNAKTTNSKDAEYDPDIQSHAKDTVKALIQDAIGAAKIPSSTTSTSHQQKPFLLPNPSVDTSLERINVLTSDDWSVAFSACVEGRPPMESAKAVTANYRAAPGELIRERNKVNARNTRLRKKAYHQELVNTLKAMAVERETIKLEETRVKDQREARFRVVDEFLSLRGSNEQDATRWLTVIDEKCQMTLPSTDYRKMVPDQSGDVFNLEQVLQGVDQIMADCALVSEFLQCLSPGEDGISHQVELHFSFQDKDFFMNGHSATLNWKAMSTGTVDHGVILKLKGSLACEFCPESNKLLSVDFSFDTGTVWKQLPLPGSVPRASTVSDQGSLTMPSTELFPDDHISSLIKTTDDVVSLESVSDLFMNR